jgi:oxygen-independent coproporphyrinogen-3 oxidase
MEALLMGLRLDEGVDISTLSARFSIDSGDLLDWKAVDKLETLGFVHRAGRHVSVTSKGFPLLDAILPQIVAIEPAPEA